MKPSKSKASSSRQPHADTFLATQLSQGGSQGPMLRYKQSCGKATGIEPLLRQAADERLIIHSVKLDWE